jgi:hypothetical protein
MNPPVNQYAAMHTIPLGQTEGVLHNGLKATRFKIFNRCFTSLPRDHPKTSNLITDVDADTEVYQEVLISYEEFLDVFSVEDIKMIRHLGLGL